MMKPTYTRDEVTALVRALSSGQRPECPRCSRPFEIREVRPRPDVSYVRDRIWLTCGECGGSAVIDRGRLEGMEGSDE